VRLPDLAFALTDSGLHEPAEAIDVLGEFLEESLTARS